MPIPKPARFKMQIPEWHFSPKQLLAMYWWANPEYNHCSGIIADGAVRSGKTISLSFGFLIWAMANYNGHTFGMCGKTIQSFYRNVGGNLMKMAFSLGFQCQYYKSDNLLVVWSKDGKITNQFYIFGGKDEGSQDLIQGITLAGLLLDEVTLMPESFVNQALARCSVTGAKIWMNCNPEGTQHYIKKRFVDNFNALRFLYLHFTMDDNWTLSEERRAFYKRQYTGLFYRRYILGEWCLASGLVMSAFDPETMVYDEDDEETNYTVSFTAGDYGTTNPTAFVWLCYNSRRNTFDVRDEYYYSSRDTEQQKSDREYCEDLYAWTKGKEIQRAYIDPSAASFAVALKQAHVFARLEKANNDVLDGIRWTNSLFSLGLIRINRKCKNLIRELGLYSWDDEKSEKTGIDTVLKISDHAVDALRYACMTEVYGRRNIYGLKHLDII